MTWVPLTGKSISELPCQTFGSAEFVPSIDLRRLCDYGPAIQASASRGALELAEIR